MTPALLFRRLLPVMAIGLVFSLTTLDAADAARRGGGFGSRGSRTFLVPRSTQTAPSQAAPIQRSMTPQQTQAARPGQPAAARPNLAIPGARPGGFLQRWGGPLLGGLMLGGLVGMLMGHGLGGMAGMMGMLLQVGLIALVAMLAMKLFRRRQDAAPAMAGGPAAAMGGDNVQSLRERFASPYQPAAAPAAGVPEARDGDEIGIVDRDFDAFQQLLGEINDAYGAEDYAALRERCTPEIVSFLSEELSKNAVAGRRNEVKDTVLLSGDLSEAWTEGETDYATVAMRYSTIDLMHDRSTGAVVEGDPDRPIESTEVWTFARQGGPWGGRWKLSAIQEV